MARTQPGDPFVWYGVALEYRSLGRIDDAEVTFRKLMGEFPDYVAAYLMAAQLFVQQGKVADAREALHLGIETAIRKNNAHARGEMEALLAELGGA